MKYILWPIVAIIMVITILTTRTIYGVLLTMWHFHIPTAREVYTIDNHYLFEDWDWKQFLREMIDYDYYKESEE